MNSRNYRIERVVRYYCKTKKKFAEKFGRSSQWVTNITSENYPIGNKTIDAIVKEFPNVSRDWLLHGTGNMLIVSDDNNQNEAREIDPEYMDVELISKYAYAGYMSGFGDVDYVEMLPKIKVITDRAVHGNYKCFEVKGDSMFDNSFESWADGDIVLCREVKRELWLPKLHINKCDFVIVHKEGIIIKRIIEQNNNDGSLVVHSLNPDKSAYSDTKIYMNDIMQIFAVVKLVDRVARR